MATDVYIPWANVIFLVVAMSVITGGCWAFTALSDKYGS